MNLPADAVKSLGRHKMF